MFVQVIQGPVADRETLMRLAARWREEVKPGAIGFLGGTAGVTDEGWLVNTARFESAEAARRNADRPEQSAWWAEMSKCFSDDPTFLESEEIEVLGAGGTDDAGWVQAMVGKAHDKAAVIAIEQEMAGRLAELRPEYLGGIRAWRGDEFVELAYFTSEEEARAAESRDLPSDVAERFAALRDATGPMGFEDLHDVTLL